MKGQPHTRALAITLVATIIVTTSVFRTLVPRETMGYNLLVAIELLAICLGAMAVILWLRDLDVRLTEAEAELTEQALRLSVLHETAKASREELELERMLLAQEVNLRVE